MKAMGLLLRPLAALCVLAAVATVATVAAVDVAAQVHRIARGETLYGIAKKYGVPVSVLQSSNGITDPTRLRSGQQLTIPRAHVMRKGDTIYSVGRKYGVNPALILAANEIIDPTTVRIGQVLVVPEAGTGPEPQTPTPAAARRLPVAAGPAAAVRTGGGEHRLWPTDGQRTRINGKLTGLKIAGTEGAAVRSVSSGTVRWASPSRGFGQVVLVENPLGYIFGYLGSAETYVAVGDRVEIGTEIGRLGLNPHDQKPNLYFLVFKDGIPADPWQAPRV